MTIYFLKEGLRTHGAKVNNIDAFIMPSRWEGPGHTIIEALSIGMPSIVSDCRYGPAESVGYGEYAYVFKTDDVEDLLDKINILHRKYSFSVEMAQKASSKMHIYMPITVRHKINTVLEIYPK